MNNLEPTKNWYQRLFGGNNVLRLLTIILLILVIVYLFDKIGFVFAPIGVFLGAVGAPIIIASVLYYLLNPLKLALMKRLKFPKTLAVATVLAVLVLVIVLILSIVIPFIVNQISALIKAWPDIFKNIQHWVDILLKDPRFANVRDYLTQANSNFSKDLTSWGQKYLTNGIDSVSHFASALTHVGTTLIATPFMLFYLLKDGNRMPHYMAQFLPATARSSWLNLLTEMNTQIANYVRGQLTVAFAVMIMFAIGWSIIGLPYAIVLAIAAGLFNLIPVLGSFIAQIPAVLIALFVDPKMVLFVLLVVAIEQPIEGHLISPLILGDTMKIHPVTVIVVLLSASSLFGLMGVIFAIPGYAVLKVLVTHIYQWWKDNSALFNEPEVVVEEVKND